MAHKMRNIWICALLLILSAIPTMNVFAIDLQASDKSIESAIPANDRTALANKVVQVAKKYLGVPYKLGANYNRDGSYKFDCSSYTQKVFSEVGIKLPRTVTTQLKATKKVRVSSVRIGDLVYFDTDFSGGTNHVGIYIGNGQVIHASTAKGGKVQITNVSKSSYWRKTVTYVTRVF